MKSVLSALPWFFKTMKHAKSGPRKYYYFLLTNNKCIRVGAHYSTTLLKKKIKNITVWRGSKNDIQIEKWSSQWKIFHTPKLKEKNKFLGYLAILKLSRKDILYKNGREGTSCGTKWLLSGSLQLPVIGMGLFERRQHYNNSCTINCQETFMILDF